MPITKNNSHLIALSQALLVTFLWSTSWVLIKVGLKIDLPPVTFAGLRYTLAFLCLLPFVLFHSLHRQTLSRLPARHWVELTLLGIVFYAMTQGAQFVSLSLLPSATLSLLLNTSPIFIALYGISNRSETTSLVQWGGILLSVIGTLIYFLPFSIEGNQITGLLAAFVALLANAISSVFGRYINTQDNLTPLLVTTVSMGIGGILMLIIGIVTQGMGTLNLTQWVIIGWLAVVNTALAFTLWNKSLQTLTAVESSIVNGTMLPQIAILAWVFLGEPLGGREIIGLILVLTGTMVVQVWRYLPASKNRI